MIRMHREFFGWAFSPLRPDEDSLAQATVATEAAVQAVQQAIHERDAAIAAERARVEQAAIAAAAAAESLRQKEDERNALLAQQGAERETEKSRQEELARQAQLAAEALRQAEERERQSAIEAQHRAEALAREADEARSRERDAAEQEAMARATLEQAELRLQALEQEARDRQDAISAEALRASETERQQSAADAQSHADAMARKAEEAERQAAIQQTLEREEASRILAAQQECERAEQALQQREAAHVLAKAEVEEAAERVRVDELQRQHAAAEQAVQCEQARIEAMRTAAEQQNATLAAEEAERERAMELAELNHNVEIAREQVRRELEQQRTIELESAQSLKAIDQKVEALQADAVLKTEGLRNLEQQRDGLAVYNYETFGDANPTVQYAWSDTEGWTHAQGTQNQLIEEKASRLADNTVYVDSLALQPNGEIITNVSLLPNQETEQANFDAELAGALDDRERAATILENINKTFENKSEEHTSPSVGATEGVTLKIHDTPTADQHVCTASFIEAPQPQPLAEADHAISMVDYSVMLPLATALAVKGGVELYDKAHTWYDNKFGEKALAPEPQDSVSQVISSLDAEPALSPDAVRSQIELDHLTPSAADQVLDQGQVLGSVDLAGKSPEQVKAEAGLAEWAAFKEEQAALQAAITEAQEAGNLEKAEMLSHRMHLDGSGFTHKTAEDVYGIACSMHGEDSIQAADARLRADDWGDRHEALENAWAVKAVRNDLYEPTTPQMAEEVTAWREKEKEENETFEKEVEGMSGRELTDARAEHREKQDAELLRAFEIQDHSLSYGMSPGATL